MKVSVVLACVLLAGCGSATSSPEAAAPGDTPTATPTAASSATPSPTSAPTPAPDRKPLSGFPLVRGYPLTNGDDGTPVAVSPEPGVDTLTFCGRRAWSPDGAADVVGTTYTGEAEDVRGRTLARYAGQDAVEVVATLRDAVEACPVERLGDTDQVYELVPGDAVDESFYVTHRYRTDAGFVTGLQVLAVQRLDDLVLLSSEYGEGGGTPASISRSVREVVDQMSAFMPELCEYAAHPCAQRETAPVVAVGPDGVEDVTLGMTSPGLEAAGFDLEPKVSTGCRAAYRDDPSAMYAVMADVRPGVGVVAVWATTWSRTPEGVGSGSSPDEVEAAYPGTARDREWLVAPVPGRVDRTYRFYVGPDHLVTDVTLARTGQACES